MRLLRRDPSGEFSLTEHTDQNVPVYAILSHTWGEEEVIFQDVETGTGKSKAGWKKIEFCAKQAAADGLEYFWVDTCCIDKKNAVELSTAINSMFRWYQKAARCYAYLTDVSKQDGGQHGQPNAAWEPAFRKSRWFTRGWTLQELIAPKQVDFFSSEGMKLGSKSTLESMIHEITGISRNALQGDALSDFPIEERISWTKHRHTTIEEDKAYCLLGIFDVSIALIYGEGGEKAFLRLQQNIHRSYKGTDFEQFAIELDLSALPEAAQFVSRKKELAEMHQLLYGHTTRAGAVLHGLGGIGKTQLSIAYTRQHKEKYTAIFWLNANDGNSLMLSFRDIAQQILKAYPATSTLAGLDLVNDLDQVVDKVRAWLELRENTRWLMIYDNYDNPKIPANTDPSAVDLRQYLPRTDHGSIIITTRSSQVKLGQRIHVEKLPIVQEGLEILSNTSGRKGIENDPDAIELVKELDGLPLALSTAGAYLEQVTTSFSDYLQMYKASWLRLQQTSPQLSSYEDRSLFTTWQITFDRIQQQNTGSAKLLKLWAYFDRQDIWFELLHHSRYYDEEWMQELTEDRMSFDNAIRLLRDYGLVDADLSFREQVGSNGYSMHSCVHSWTEFVLNKEWDDRLAGIAMTCVLSIIPNKFDDKWWLLQRRLLRHASRQEQCIKDGKILDELSSWALFQLGLLYSSQGMLIEAETMYTQALRGYEETVGPKDIFTLGTVQHLGMIYSELDKQGEAESMYLRALHGYEELLGPKHMSTLYTANNLGNFYATCGKLAEAEMMCTRALQGEEEVLGPKHISTLNTLHNLALIYSYQGSLLEAETTYLRVLQGFEETIGPKHIATLDTVHNLGILYFMQGRMKDSEAMYIRALRGTEEGLGPKHLSTLHTVRSLALLYDNQGKLAEAEAMNNRALQSYEATLGPKHAETLATIHNLGNLYMSQSKLAEAEAMYLRVLRAREETLGPKDILTNDMVHNLGHVYSNQGKLAEAEAMYLRSLQCAVEVLGPNHTSTLDTVGCLARLYSNHGRLIEAEAMLNRALQGYETTLGQDLMSSHIPTLETAFNLGDLFAKINEADNARRMYARALSGFTAVQGPSSTWCSKIEARLQALELKQTELQVPKDSPPKAKSRKSRSLVRSLFRSRQ